MRSPIASSPQTMIAIARRTEQPVVQVWIRERKVLRNPQGVFVECGHGDGTAGSVSALRAHNQSLFAFLGPIVGTFHVRVVALS
jgi:hypothetical protein